MPYSKWNKYDWTMYIRQPERSFILIYLTVRSNTFIDKRVIIKVGKFKGANIGLNSTYFNHYN